MFRKAYGLTGAFRWSGGARPERRAIGSICTA
nr:hypothetical protein [Mesorhizobium japonicum]